ncbi:MAG: DUF1538 domain-containing protein [Proteobacteria bacterium]|nr:DUF1538 domain-containing protein [Pseudomonadota bacterium]NOG59343.1 DUF1538 domain-containing protein [Pseudomonadota bacterium]
MSTLKQVRFGTLVREITMHQEELSYNELAPEIEQDKYGVDLVCRPSKIKLRSIDVYRLAQPYLTVRLIDQVKAVLPLAIYLVLFQLLILRQNVSDSWIITAGLLSVIIGLMLFMEGLKVGLMPFGETIGNILPSKAKLPTVLLIVFLLGIGVTFAEPAIGALKAAGSIVNVEQAPYLYSLLNTWSEVLVLMVGIGVGLAAVLGTLRFIYGWSLKPLIYISLIPTIGLTLYIMADEELSKMLGLAWDCGAVTTGPVTVPLVLSLGIGIATAAGKGRSSLSGFGIVTLASLFPIVAVELLAVFVSIIETPQMIISEAVAMNSSTASLNWHEKTPYVEIISGIRAIIPLVLFLIFILLFVLKEKIRHPGTITYGIILSVIGMIIFNIGLSYGLAKLGSQSGGLVPGAFTQIELVSDSPLYSLMLGISIALIFAWILGFGATLAEPALNALGMTVENLTNGAFRKKLLMYSVSFGVGFGIALGIVKIIYSIPIAYIVVPGYLIAIVLTYFSTEEFVNIAWDSAGVTTGPVTVPLVLAMGLGFGEAVGAIEGFGILSMASIGPIISVMTTGLWIQWKVKRRRESEYEVVESVEGAKS